MSPTLQNIAVAGASGLLGKPIIAALLSSGFTVTALTRAGSTSQPTFPSGVTVKEVDYSSPSSLESALQNQHALISALTTTSLASQYPLFTAAIKVGVKRILPSEFGSDTTAAANRDNPVYKQKIEIEAWLAEQVKGTETTYTSVINNCFLDWGLSFGFLANVKEKKISLWDGGETEYSVTTLAGVAKGVVGILKHPEQTRNRHVKIHDAVLTQKKLLKLAQKAVGEEGWTVDEPSTAEAEKKSWEVFKAEPSNVFGWLLGFLQRAIFCAENEPKFGDADSELLGVPRLTDDEVVAEIKKVA